MTAAETWRVVLEPGEVREVRVTPLDDGNYVAMSGYVDGEFDYQGYGDAPRSAVVELSTDTQEGWPVVEIVAPGSLTAAERIAALVDRAVAACNAVRDRELVDAEQDVGVGGIEDASQSQHYAAACAAIECADAIRESAR